MTHSLVGAAVWGLLVAGGYLVITRRRRGGGLLFVGVLSHWLLDVATHRPDVPLLPPRPVSGIGLWNSIPATLAVETAMFGGGIALDVSVRKTRASFWALIIVLFALYLGAGVHPAAERHGPGLVRPDRVAAAAVGVVGRLGRAYAMIRSHSSALERATTATTGSASLRLYTS